MKRICISLALWMMASITFAQSQWEYAIFAVNTRESPQGNSLQIAYISNTGDATASSWDEFGQKMNTDTSKGVFSILRKAGEAGFELVSYSTDSLFVPQVFGINDTWIGKTEVWVFKRLKPSQ